MTRPIQPNRKGELFGGAGDLNVRCIKIRRISYENEAYHSDEHILDLLWV